jgi:ubiquinone/menaquinone biosynthesis C-methylase UbiE
MKILIRKLDTEKTKRSYKKVAWFYNFWSWLTESKAAKQVLEISEIRDNTHVLEVACGTGLVFKKIVQRNPHGKNIGVDISPDMLDRAKYRLADLKDADYELKEGDAINLDFPNNTFDTVINNFMVDLMPIELFDQIAKEFFRVLKPNGVVIVSTFSFGKRKINKIWHWVAEYMPDLLTGCRPVSFKENLVRAGFEIKNDLEISQNSFPSEIIKAKKES